MTVLLAVAGVGEPSITAVKLATEWFLSWKKKKMQKQIIQFHISFSNSLLRRVTDDDGILVFNEKTLSFSLSLLHLL